MKYLITTALLFLTTSTFAVTAEIQKQIEKTKQVHKLNASITTEEYKFPNGLTVFFTENPKSPNVVVAHWVKAGSLHEVPGTTGIAHLFEHMMFRPLKPGSPTFFEIASQLGGDLNANTRFESTFYFTAVEPKKLNQLLKHEADRFQNLVVTKELLDVERKAVWSEYSTKFDANPILDLWFQIYQQGYKGHPLGWHIIGFREDLEKITAEDANKFFQSYYKPNNVGLFVTGNFKTKEALKQVMELYADWKPGKETKLPAPFEAKTKELIGEGKLPSEAKFILFGFRTPYVDSSNAKLQTLVNAILFDSEHGLAKKRLVDNQRIAAEVSDFNFEYDNGMMKAGIVGLPTTKVADIRTALLQLPKDFEALSNEDFEIYKRNFFIQVGENVQRNSQLSDLLAVTWGKYGDLKMASDFSSKPLEVTREQVQQFINKYYVPDNFILMTHKGQGK